MIEPRRRILVTSALPYANGPIHIGHLVEYIQTDIWVRFQKLRGHECWYVCADDAHGTPIMLKARADGVTPEALIERVGREHRADFAAFDIGFDNYHTTHSEENRRLAVAIYERLRDGGHVVRRAVRQLYDPVERMFLPDRFIRGRCPRCGAADQYGDSCEACGATYDPTELGEPVSVLSGARPEELESEHLFVRLADFEPLLREWTGGGRLQPEVRHKLEEWFRAGLKDWDISRDAPYFGFEIPDAPGKYFYVWLDAPIGYLASFRNLCDRKGLDFDAWCARGADAEMYHFIGKDIVYFHALFWPAMLHGAGFKLPDAVYAHGFLTVNGQKMSKSRGTFITARTWLEHLDPEALRYYFAAKLGGSVADIDLNLDDFVSRVNSDLVGKLVNIASRCASLLHRHFGGRLAGRIDGAGAELAERFRGERDTMAARYEAREYAAAVRGVMAMADAANQYIHNRRPWARVKEGGGSAEAQEVLTAGMEMFRILALYLKPVLPGLARKAEALLAVAPMRWASLDEPLGGGRLAPFEPLAQRVDPARVRAMVGAAAGDLEQAPAQGDAGRQGPAREPTIGLEDLARVDLRVARVIEANPVEGSDKLLRLQVDLGGGDQRQVLAGIRSAYTPEALVGRLVVVVANLAPRKMRFGVSEAMLLAAGPGDGDIWLLAPDAGAEPGMRVR